VLQAEIVRPVLKQPNDPLFSSIFGDLGELGVLGSISVYRVADNVR